jgi:hypothetical protein
VQKKLTPRRISIWVVALVGISVGLWGLLLRAQALAGEGSSSESSALIWVLLVGSFLVVLTAVSIGYQGCLVGK